MIAQTVAMILGVKDAIVHDGPIVVGFTALYGVLYGVLYGAGWVFLHITAVAAG